MAISDSIHTDPGLIRVVRELALEGFEKPGLTVFPERERYAWLREMGSRLWLDTGDAAAAEGTCPVPDEP